jgi:nitrogen fixation NifU-like protein
VYSKTLLDRFQNPRNVGDVENPTARVSLQNPACGDVLEISLQLADGMITNIRFRAKGCVAAIACGSAVTELAMGTAAEQARRLQVGDVVNFLEGLPATSNHAAVLAIEALHSVLESSLITSKAQ